MNADNRPLIPERLHGDDTQLDEQELEHRAAKALLLRSRGLTCKEVAERAELDVETVRGLSRRNRGMIRDMAEAIKHRIQEPFSTTSTR